MCKNCISRCRSIRCTLQDFIKICFHKCLKAQLGFFFSTYVNIPELSPTGSLVSVEVVGRECYNVTFGRGGAGRVLHPLE